MCVFTSVESGAKNGKIELQIMCIRVILRRFFAKTNSSNPFQLTFILKKKERKKTQPLRNICTFPRGILSSPYHSLTVYVDLLRFEVGAMMTIVGCHNSI